MATERLRRTSPTEAFVRDDSGPHTAEEHEGHDPTESPTRDHGDEDETVTEFTITPDEQDG